MSDLKLYIKNMVCDRCKLAVKHELEQHQISYSQIDLGEVTLSKQPSEKQLQNFSQSIEKLGFARIEDRTARTISKIKNEVITITRSSESKKQKLSVQIAETLNKDYSMLSNLFSSVEGMTIEHYAILQKIEYVKELLVYDELSLSEIADQLQYSSVQHLSNQFKKITGLTPSHFKKIGLNRRLPLDRI